MLPDGADQVLDFIINELSGNKNLKLVMLAAYIKAKEWRIASKLKKLTT